MLVVIVISLSYFAAKPAVYAAVTLACSPTMRGDKVPYYFKYFTFLFLFKVIISFPEYVLKKHMKSSTV